MKSLKKKLQKLIIMNKLFTITETENLNS